MTNRSSPESPAAGPARTYAQTPGEEIANSVSHGIGFLLAVAATPVLIYNAVRNADAGFVTGVSIFGATMMLLYLSSTLYHALTHARAKRVLRVIDHSTIYLLIAGTYTPFTLGVLSGAWGWTLFGLVWGIALVGVILKATGKMGHPILSTVLYLPMGWLIVIAVKPLYLAMSAFGLFWLAAGGVAYTAGVAFYAAPRMRYAHFIWHLFVLLGTTCHFIAVLNYASG